MTSTIHDLTPLTFADRESYLKWRSTWRLEYRRLSGEIREHKHFRRESVTEGRTHGPWWHQAMRETRRRDAALMMAIRTDSKLKAARLMAAERERIAA